MNWFISQTLNALQASFHFRVTGRETRCRGEMGKHHDSYLHLIRIPCPQDHLVPVLWDQTNVGGKVQDSSDGRSLSAPSSVWTVNM